MTKEILVSLTGKKIPVEVDESVLRAWNTSSSEFELTIRVFSNGYGFKPSDGEEPDEVVHKGKVVVISNLKQI